MGGQNSCFRIPGGQALHAVQYNIYIVKFQGGANLQQGGGGGGECPAPLNETLLAISHVLGVLAALSL